MARHVRKISVIAAGATGAGLAVFLYKRNKNNETTVHSYGFTDQFEPPFNACGRWDHNWDFREPRSLMKLSKENKENENYYKDEIRNHRSKAVRHIFLVRHGEYLDKGDTDSTHQLTERGRTQAKYTGQRLRDLGIRWDEVIVSTMTRAQETADIVLKEIDCEHKTVHCPFIREGAPIRPQPPVEHWKPDSRQFFRDGARIEAAFRRYFHRADISQKNDSYTLLVGHGNVIRYFVCRALQFPPEGWLRISINHASITWLVIHPNGNVQIKLLGESGHLPVKLLTNRIPRDVV